MKRKIKNIILKGITGIMVFLFVICVSATEITLTTSIIMLVSLAWILLFTLANKERFE